jgi:hypothetical protein
MIRIGVSELSSQLEINSEILNDKKDENVTAYDEIENSQIQEEMNIFTGNFIFDVMFSWCCYTSFCLHTIGTVTYLGWWCERSGAINGVHKTSSQAFSHLGSMKPISIIID